MKELDFLPQSFHEAIRRRRRTRRNLVYSLAVVTALAVLNGLMRSEIRTAEAALSTFREGSGLRGTQRARLVALKQVRASLRTRAELLSRLDDDAPVDAVIAEIRRQMNPGMALRSISIRSGGGETVQPPGVAAAVPPLVTGSPPVNGGMEGVLQGVAPSDVDVGTFFGRLSSSPLLEEVRLSYSREAQQSGRSMREFELKFRIRRVALAPADASETGPAPSKTARSEAGGG